MKNNPEKKIARLMKTKKMMMTIAVLLCSVAVSAHDFEVDGIYYQYATEGVYVTYAGDSYSATQDEYSGDIIIPSTVTYYGKERKVVSIGANAFRDCEGVTSVIIGDNVKEIGSCAFRGCNNLKYVSLGKSVYSISDAFYYCDAIESVHYNCIYVGKCAVNNSSVMNITLGENVKSVGDFSGTGWYNKQPEGLLYLDNWLIGYKGDAPNGDIIIADGTTHINESAFSYCEYITSVTIPKSVIYIGDFFLRHCDAIVGLSVDKDNVVFDSRENCNAIIETNSNTIIKACINTIIPQTITKIGMCSFETLGIVEISIPDNVVEISGGAFSFCERLERVIIGNGVTSIGDNAFHGCFALENLSLGDKVEIIGKQAFAGCVSLLDVKLPNSVIRIKEDAFNGTGWYNNQSEYPYVLDGWILYDVGWPYIKDGIRGIADRVYYYHDASGSSSLKIPNTVYAIGEWAFSHCAIYDVVLPNSIKYIATGAFSNNGLSYVSVPQGVNSISSATFQNCRNLSKVVIPKSVTKIESAAFYLCSKITELYILAANPPRVDNSGTPVFDAIYDKSTLYVPKGSKEEYLQDAEWSKFANIVEIETEYKITYVLNDSVVLSDTLTIGENIEGIEMPSKIGYSFNWEKLPSNMPAEDITINGVYTPKQYSIKYNVDGKLYKITNINYGDSIFVLDEPIKEGHTFSGWDSIPIIMPAADVTINGTFAVNSYKVTYTIDGEIFATDSIVYGDSIPLIDTPVKDGHTFSGWDGIPVTMPAADVIVSGTFAVNSYKVTYTIDGEIFATDSIVYGDSIPLIDAPVKEGYTFSGWDSIPVTMPAADVIVSGTFAVSSYKVIYTIDGEIFATDSIVYGDSIPLIDAPVKEGYTFSGWDSIPVTMPAADVIVSGTFAVSSYKVIYTIDGEIFATDSIVYGDSIPLIDAPVKEGYTFYGWSDAPTTMPAEDVTINGSFEVNTYAVTYIVDGDTVAVDSVAYGTEITPIAVPVKEGYTFSGWSEAAATMPANDIVISGSFEINTYVVTYIVDGKTFATDSIVFNGDVNVISAPEKEGYTFSGWSYAPKKMPAEDIVISGTFSVNYYTITYLVDGEEYKSEQVAYGTEIKLLDAPVKEGYTFSGWSDTPMTMPAEDITIIGSFVATGISNVSADAAVKVNGKSITLSGANNSTVTIFSTSGALVEKIDCYDGEEITLDKGVYIVRVGEKTMKVRL